VPLESVHAAQSQFRHRQAIALRVVLRAVVLANGEMTVPIRANIACPDVVLTHVLVEVGIRLTQVGPICSVWEWWKSIRVI
jgi:hypothetical protein